MSISANLRAPDTSIVGLCAQKGADPRLWDYSSNTTHTPDEVRRAEWAIRECKRCPSLDTCRARILAVDEGRKGSGIVAAMTPTDRRRERGALARLERNRAEAEVAA